MRYKNWPLRRKMLSLVALSALMIASLGIIAEQKMAAIGTLLKEVVEEDIPLTSRITRITVHQLEQAIELERAERYILKVGFSDDARKRFDAAVSHFRELAEQVDREILEAEEIAEHGISHAAQEGTRAEFKAVLAALKEIEVEHKDYTKHGEEVIALLQAGQHQQAEALALDVAAEQDAFDKKLGALLFKVEDFTARAAAHAEQQEHAAERFLWIAMAIAVAIISAVGIFMVNRIVRPLLRSIESVDALAAGDTSVQFEHDAKDEVGRLAVAIESLRQATIRLNELQANEARRDQEAQQRLKKEMLDLSDDLDKHVQEAVRIISEQTRGMQSTADQMSNAAQEVSAQSKAVTASAENATENVQTVASAAEEMSSSVTEINRQVERSNEITQQAVNEANQSNEKVQSLTEAAKQIEAIVILINEIADQTNLLALNATIEAARAGEAGKGFAVVASEVKSLANQTAKATDQIGQQIKAIQNATGEAATAIKSIGETVNEVSDITLSISGAVKEQSSATDEIARSAQGAATGTREVTTSITEVARATQQSGELANEVRGNAEEVNQSVLALQNKLTEILRGSQAGNRRNFARVKLDQRSQVHARGRWHDCIINDLSAGGAEIAAIDGLDRGDVVKLRVPRFGEVSGCIVRTTQRSSAIDFELDDAAREKLDRFVCSFQQEAA